VVRRPFAINTGYLKRMNKAEIRMRVPDTGGVVELEMSTPLHSEAGIRLWATLARLRINPFQARLQRRDERLVASIRLAEYDRSPITAVRVEEILGVLQRHLPADAVVSPE
jgi:hypothetical protein